MPSGLHRTPAPSPARGKLLSLLRGAEAIEWSEADWHAVLAVTPLGLAPYLACRARTARMTLPASIAAVLEATERAAVATHLRRQAAVRRALDVLDQVAIPSIVLKGAALAHQVYPEPALRTMRDVDFWVPPADLDRAVAALVNDRFRPKAGTDALPSVTRARARTDRHVDDPATSVTIELHGALPSLTGLPWSEFGWAWRSATVPATLGGRAARVLAPEQLLTHVCLHASRIDCFAFGLRAIVDVTLIVTRWQDEWNWPAMIGTWQDHRIADWMLLSLTLARDLLRAPVPDQTAWRSALPPRWAEMRALSEELVYHADHTRLPAAARAAAVGGATAWLRSRLLEHYWRAPGTRGALTVLREALRLARHDLLVKIPDYVRRWRAGQLRGSAFRQAAALERARRELAHLVAESGGAEAISP